MSKATVRNWQVYGTVVRVIDGDSLVSDLDLGWGVWQRQRTVRVAHMNAPELHVSGKSNPAGVAARAFAEQLLTVGSVVQLVSHSLDKYGRALCSVTLADGRDFATCLIVAGHGVAYEGGAK